MTVSTQVSRNEYTGNGATTQYDFTFRILDKSHLLVQTLDTSESIVTLTLGTDYTVTGVNRYNGGKVVLNTALPAGYKISIERKTPVTQEASIRNQGGFFPEIHEDAFDKLTMLVQQAYGWWSGLSLRKPSWLANYYDALNNRIRNLRDPSQAQDAATKGYADNLYQGAISHSDNNFKRTLRVPESEVGMLPGISGRRKKILAFNDAGNPIAVLPESGSAADVLIELGSSELPGLSLVALPESGNLSHAIPEVYVDAFGADPTGSTDSTAAILSAISRATGGILVSNFSKTKTKFAKVIFGPGQYQANNITVVSGVEYCGQGEFATAVFPSVAGADVFRTTGTTASNSDPEQRMAGAKIRDMTVGCGLWTTDLHTRPAGAGGIYLKSMTYCLLENLRISRLNGRGLRIEGGWDSDFVNIKITDTGSGTSVSNAVPGLYIGNAVDGSVSDPSNALRFRGLQLENNVQNFHLDHDCRHITFDSPKIETSKASIRIPSIIGGVRAVSFNSAELTWQYQDQPMIRITNDQPHFGVSFNNPRPVSSTVSMGWYFDHLSTQMPLAINDADGFALWKLVTGRNVKIQGGEIMNCGPCIIDLTSDVYIRDFNAIVSVASVAGNGSDDTIRVNGDNVHIEGCNLYCAGSVTDGSAAIYVGASCANPTIKNNTLRGTKNYGIRVLAGATIAANRLCDNNASSSYGGLITGYTARYGVTARNDYTGFGYGSVKGQTLTLSAGASATLSVIAGASDIQIRTVNSGGGITAGKYFADYSSTAFNEISKLNGIVIGSGVPGDGFIYLSKSGTNLTITNNTLLDITVYLLLTSAQQ